jgi:hypothetical protein
MWHRKRVCLHFVIDILEASFKPGSRASNHGSTIFKCIVGDLLSREKTSINSDGHLTLVLVGEDAGLDFVGVLGGLSTDVKTVGEIEIISKSTKL